MNSRGFLIPGDEVSLWREDKVDLNKESGTSYIFNRNVTFPIEDQRSHLPIFNHKNEILYLLEKFQVLIITGETGSGKSTQVPQYLYEAGWCGDDKMIGISEPRRYCATTLANRVAEEQKCTVGTAVGYSIRFDDCANAKSTKIKFVTEGILIREMMADPLLRRYAVIILDEVHERTLFTDIVMGLLKKILKKRKSLKLIVTSATVDAIYLKNYFNDNISGDDEKDTSTILRVQGRTHPVTLHYLKEPTPDYVICLVETVLKIHERESEGDILGFLTGCEDVDRAVDILKEHSSHIPKNDYRLLILPMYGALPNSEQQKVFRTAPRGFRKVVIATNIAETSITIPGIVYVVDGGFVKMRWFNPETYVDSLIVAPISKASAIQRAGRAGRIKPGKVYRLYTERDFEDLIECAPPEMQRIDLSSGVLQLKALGIDNVLRFSFPSPPPAKHLTLALELLYALGAIDESGQLTTPIGTTMAELPLPPLHARTLLAADEFDCVDEISGILAMLQIDNIYVKPRSGSAAIKARIEKRKFEVEEGDLLTMLNTFAAFRKNESDAKNWCQKRFLNYKGLIRAQQIKSQMISVLEKFDIQLTSTKDTKQVLRCIAKGFFPNAAYLHYSGVYKTVRGDETLYVHPSSVLYSENQPKWVLYAELVCSDKMYMKDLTTVKPSWLEDLAPHFYHMAPIT